MGFEKNWKKEIIVDMDKSGKEFCHKDQQRKQGDRKECGSKRRDY